MTKITLQEDIKTKKKLKDILESSWDKIIFVDNKNLSQKGYLFTEVLRDALLNEGNHKLVLPAEGKQECVRIANYQAAIDLKKIVGNRFFRTFYTPLGRSLSLDN